MHAAGRVTVKEQNKHLPSHVDLSSVTATHHFRFDESYFYNTLETYGFTYGPSLRCIKQGSTDYKDCLVRLEIPESTDLKRTFIHTAVLDSILQSGVVLLAEVIAERGVGEGGQVLPYGVDEIILYRKLVKDMFLYMRPAKFEEFTWKIDAVLLDPTGVVLAEAKGITYGQMGHHLNYDVEQHLFTSSWKHYELEQVSEQPAAGNTKLLILHDHTNRVPAGTFSTFKTTNVLLSKRQLADIAHDEGVLQQKIYCIMF